MSVPALTCSKPSRSASARSRDRATSLRTSVRIGSCSSAVTFPTCRRPRRWGARRDGRRAPVGTRHRSCRGHGQHRCRARGRCRRAARGNLTTCHRGGNASARVRRRADRAKSCGPHRRALGRRAAGRAPSPRVATPLPADRERRDRRVAGFETLLRWEHPERGLLRPAEFLPLAERSGAIVPIGRWAIEEACRQVAVWHEHSGSVLKLNINLSTRQFTEPTLSADLERIVADAGLAPGVLWLEITEATLLHDRETSARTLDQLHDLGVQLVIDDFGTGASSLASLKHFPLDAIKIDGAFVADLGRNRDSDAICGAIVDLAHSLGLSRSWRAWSASSSLPRSARWVVSSRRGICSARPARPTHTATRRRCRSAWFGVSIPADDASIGERPRLRCRSARAGAAREQVARVQASSVPRSVSRSGLDVSCRRRRRRLRAVLPRPSFRGDRRVRALRSGLPAADRPAGSRRVERAVRTRGGPVRRAGAGCVARACRSR